MPSIAVNSVTLLHQTRHAVALYEDQHGYIIIELVASAEWTNIGLTCWAHVY